MSVECQVNVKSQSELDIGGRETCSHYADLGGQENFSVDFTVCKLQRG